jgi:hypothetical protein
MTTNDPGSSSATAYTHHLATARGVAVFTGSIIRGSCVLGVRFFRKKMLQQIDRRFRSLAHALRKACRRAKPRTTLASGIPKIAT